MSVLGSYLQRNIAILCETTEEREFIQWRDTLIESDISQSVSQLLLLLRRTLCVLMYTSVVARWMSAPAWTSRSTTSVCPFWLATYTGLEPTCKQRVTFSVAKRFGLSTSYSENPVNPHGVIYAYIKTCGVKQSRFVANCTM